MDPDRTGKVGREGEPNESMCAGGNEIAGSERNVSKHIDGTVQTVLVFCGIKNGAIFETNRTSNNNLEAYHLHIEAKIWHYLILHNGFFA